MSENDTENDWLRGFGAFSNSDLPEEMQKERERLHEEWSDESR